MLHRKIDYKYTDFINYQNKKFLLFLKIFSLFYFIFQNYSYFCSRYENSVT